MHKPILCLDFDGVVSAYKGRWEGATVILDPPVPGAFEFMVAALPHFDVCIFSSRSHAPGGRMAMAEWLVQHGWPPEQIDWLGCVGLDDGPAARQRARDRAASAGDLVADAIQFPAVKPPFSVGLDDRVLTFHGRFPTIEAMRAFRAWWQDNP